MWTSEQVHRCADCGTYDWEWEENQEAWVADLHWCLGCLALEELRDDTVRTAKDPRGYKTRLYRGGDDG